jgi:hypothetical protein
MLVIVPVVFNKVKLNQTGVKFLGDVRLFNTKSGAWRDIGSSL